MIRTKSLRTASLLSTALACAAALGCGASESPTPINQNVQGPGGGGAGVGPASTPAGTDGPSTVATGPDGQPVPGEPAPGAGGPAGGPGAPSPSPGDPGPDIILDMPDDTPSRRAGIYPGDKVDMLFVVDNSSSMGDKQALFVQAIPDLIEMLVNPPCLDKGNVQDPADDTIVPFDADGTCPDGVGTAFAAITDMHIAVISSSLGNHGLGGAEICPDQPHMNDQAHLISLMRAAEHPELLADSHNQLGFLAWAPDDATAKRDTPEAQTAFAALQQDLVAKFSAQVAAVAERGCGFEAPLEAAYRFLVDPDPYLTLERVSCVPGGSDTNCVAPVGTDTELLNERGNFLRPDSHVVVTYLTDENDCSIKDSGQGYYTMRPTNPMPRGTNACAANPNDMCCQSCAAMIREGCDADPATNGCAEGNDPFEATEDQRVEAFNVRCFDQKRRFGMDFLYGTDRYIAGFRNTQLLGRDNATIVDNPLFASGRDLTQVFVVGIVGTPWQDVSADPNDPAGKVQRAAALPWELFLPTETNPYPTDPFNIEAMGVREGTHPITGDVLGGPDTFNNINGFDRTIASGDGLLDDVQYACIFPLATPRDCTSPDVDANSCDCTQNPSDADPTVIVDYATGNPLCRAPDGTYGTTQYYAKAYPGPRVMEVVRGMQDQGVLGSICPQNPTDPSRPDFGYRPPIRALLLGLAGIAAR